MYLIFDFTFVVPQTFLFLFAHARQSLLAIIDYKYGKIDDIATYLLLSISDKTSKG